MNSNKKNIFVMIMSLFFTHTFFYGAALPVVDLSKQRLTVFDFPFPKLKDLKSGLYSCDEHCRNCAKNGLAGTCQARSFHDLLRIARGLYVCALPECPELKNCDPYVTSSVVAFKEHILKYKHPEGVRLVFNYKTGKYEEPKALCGLCGYKSNVDYEQCIHNMECEGLAVAENGEPVAKRRCVPTVTTRREYVCGIDDCPQIESTARDLAIHRCAAHDYLK